MLLKEQCHKQTLFNVLKDKGYNLQGCGSGRDRDGSKTNVEKEATDSLDTSCKRYEVKEI